METSNYTLAQKNGARLFLKRDQEEIIRRCGLEADDRFIYVCFLGQEYRVDRQTGILLHAGQKSERNKKTPDYDRMKEPEENRKNPDEAGFEEAMSIYDYLCDSEEGCCASGEFATIQSLQRVMTSRIGEGLFSEYAAFFAQNEDIARQRCEQLGGIPSGMGDISYDFSVWKDLKVRIVFWHSDEDFPASIQIFWDRNVLKYMRFETTYYVVGSLMKKICRKEETE